MKTCPVCKARCFDDMEICYGCMHHFKEDAESRGERSALERTSVLKAPERQRESSGRAQEGGASHHGIPRVFGAVPPDVPADDVIELEEPRASGRPETASVKDAALSKSKSAEDSPVALADNELQAALGQIATASIGNGYRLVISIEPA